MLKAGQFWKLLRVAECSGKFLRHNTIGMVTKVEEEEERVHFLIGEQVLYFNKICFTAPYLEKLEESKC